MPAGGAALIVSPRRWSKASFLLSAFAATFGSGAVPGAVAPVLAGGVAAFSRWRAGGGAAGVTGGVASDGAGSCLTSCSAAPLCGWDAASWARVPADPLPSPTEGAADGAGD